MGGTFYVRVFEETEACTEAMGEQPGLVAPEVSFLLL